MTMAQSASIRLDHSLVKEADAVGKMYKRSPPRQIEYWAELGRAIEQSVNPIDIIAIREGLSQVVVEPVRSSPVASADVFADLARDRNNGVLSTKVSNTAVNYQASTTHPGLLDQIKSDGTKTTGRFVNGKFKAFNQ
jgi:ParD-like antitoxin of type II bacterial toxin-antitoxin system